MANCHGNKNSNTTKSKNAYKYPLKSKVLSLPYVFIPFALNWAGESHVIFGSTHVGRKVFVLAKPGWL